MAERAREDLNLIPSETREQLMDPPSVPVVPERDDHVVTITPPAAAVTDASSIALSRDVALGLQALNSPCEGVPTGVSTSGTATNTQARSRAPRQQQRSRWNDPCSCIYMTFDFWTITLQIILLVVALPSRFRDEHPHAALRAWVIGYGIGCVARLPLLLWTYLRPREQSNLLPQVVDSTVSPGSQAGRRQRSGQIFKWLQISLHGFFILWFGFGTGIVGTHWAARQAPRLNSICTVLLIFTYFRFVLPLTVYAVMRWCGVRLVISRSPQTGSRGSGASASVISALPTFKFHAQVPDLEANNQASINQDDDDVRISVAGDDEAPAAEVVDECSICLDPYEEGDDLKELPCEHYFHVHCIDRWLKINGLCPNCKRKVRAARRASPPQRALATVTV